MNGIRYADNQYKDGSGNRSQKVTNFHAIGNTAKRLSGRERLASPPKAPLTSLLDRPAIRHKHSQVSFEPWDDAGPAPDGGRDVERSVGHGQKRPLR